MQCLMCKVYKTGGQNSSVLCNACWNLFRWCHDMKGQEFPCRFPTLDTRNIHSRFYETLTSGHHQIYQQNINSAVYQLFCSKVIGISHHNQLRLYWSLVWDSEVTVWQGENISIWAQKIRWWRQREPDRGVRKGICWWKAGSRTESKELTLSCG